MLRSWKYDRKNNSVIDRYPIVQNVVLINSMGSMFFDDHIVRSITPHNDQYEDTMIKHQGRCVLLLEGGQDIHPSMYGEENRHSYVDMAKGYRDIKEERLYLLAREYNIPVLGICRGHQLIAALEGGSLYQDIRSELGVHRHGSGPLILEGIFAEWYPEGYAANSAHHQCVNRVPENAVVLARDARNPEIIEAMYYPEIKVFTTQFHPEFMGDHKLLQHIIDWFFTKE